MRGNQSNPFQNLEWQGNSRKMYEAILRAVPPLFAGSVRKTIMRWLVQHQIKVVTEELVFQAVDEIAPRDLANKKIKPGLEKLRSQ